MNIVYYKIDCLTNLHMGSGDINYNIIDNEVEKDAISGLPVIHASGVKGALKDAMKGRCDVEKVFGFSGSGDAGNPGSHKFLDAYLFSRPMRVSGSNRTSSISVVTIDSVNRFLKQLSGFNMNPYGINEISIPDFGDNEFLVMSDECIRVEDENTGKLQGETSNQLKIIGNDLLGNSFAIAKNFDDYHLPVLARNYLENGISKNLWYEEVVPHDSVFTFAVIYPDNAELNFPDVVQFGGNASIGCGYCKISKLI